MEITQLDFVVWRALWAVYEEKRVCPSSRELAKMVYASAGGVWKCIDKLEALGVVEYEWLPSGRRVGRALRRVDNPDKRKVRFMRFDENEANEGA